MPMTDPMDRLTTALTGRYAIERELGAGGMATVYLAEDVVRDPLRLENGKFILRDAPGLGVDVDEDAIRRFTVA